MHIRYHAQRKHIISSLESTLYQLHTLSFFLAPSLWSYLCRCGTQYQFTRAREFDDGKYSLKFWFALIGLVNFGAVWTHASVGVSPGRAVVLDFVGMGRTPTKAQLLLLDFTIVFLQAVLTTISYETSLALAMADDTADPLMPPQQKSDLVRSEVLFDWTDRDRDEDEDGNRDEEWGKGRIRDANPFHYPPRPTTTTQATASSSSSTSTTTTTPQPHSTSHAQHTSNSQAPLPPREPIVTLNLKHLTHRLTSPVPIPPPPSTLSGQNADAVDNLGDLALPLRNGAGGAGGLARTLRIIAQAGVRRQVRLRMAEARAAAAAGGGGVGERRSGADETRGEGETRNTEGREERHLSSIAPNAPNGELNIRLPGGMYPP